MLLSLICFILFKPGGKIALDFFICRAGVYRIAAYKFCLWFKLFYLPEHVSPAASKMDSKRNDGLTRKIILLKEINYS